MSTPLVERRVDRCSLRLRWRFATLVCPAVALLSSCAVPRALPDIDPTADFAAHAAREGLVVDRNTDGRKVLVTDADGGLFARGPQLVVRSDGTTVAGIWLRDTDHLIVRRAADVDAPLVGRVQATWENGLLRLVLKSAEGETYATSRFRRMDLQREPEALGEEDESLLDVDGTYQTVLRDAAGLPVGWLRVRIDPSRQYVHVYYGDLPHSLDPTLVTAATALLDVNVTDLEEHAENPYIGN